LGAKKIPCFPGFTPWPTLPFSVIVTATSAAGLLAVRPGNIKIPPFGFSTPKFDWREMQRWGISESRLPPGSTIYFRDPRAWDQYKTQILAVTAAILLQASLIGWLLRERQYRRQAERASRETMWELTQLNRMATAGELSATIAHEVNQPLTGIVTRASAAPRWLSGESPDVGKVRDVPSANQTAPSAANARGDAEDAIPA
jgi:signal transduction histidine kinase